MLKERPESTSTRSETYLLVVHTVVHIKDTLIDCMTELATRLLLLKM